MIKNCAALIAYAAAVTVGINAGKLAWTKIETRFTK